MGEFTSIEWGLQRHKEGDGVTENTASFYCTLAAKGAEISSASSSKQASSSKESFQGGLGEGGKAGTRFGCLQDQYGRGKRNSCYLAPRTGQLQAGSRKLRGRFCSLPNFGKRWCRDICLLGMPLAPTASHLLLAEQEIGIDISQPSASLSDRKSPRTSRTKRRARETLNQSKPGFLLGL